MSTEASHSKKRALSTVTTNTSLALRSGEVADDIDSQEPPRRRLRTSLGDSLASINAPAYDYESAKLESEIQDLKTSLEHERSLRTLDQRRSRQTQSRLERQIQFALEESSDAKALLDDVRTQNDLHTEQLRNAKADALRQLRQCQTQLAQAHAEAVTESQLQMALESQETLQAKLDARDEENVALRRQLEQVVAQERSRSPAATPPTPAFLDTTTTPAPTPILRELNSVRIRLAETERQYRQLRRKADEWQAKGQQLVQQREATRTATARVVQVETELREIRQRRERDCASLESWVMFGNGLRKVLSLESTTHDGPPEVATVMRHLDMLHDKTTVLADDKAELQRQIQASQEQVTKTQAMANEKVKEANAISKECRQLTEKLNTSERKFQTLQAQEGIWRREADSLRSLLQTFDDAPPKSPDAKPSAIKEALEVSLSTAREELSMSNEERVRLSRELEIVTQDKTEMQEEHTRLVEKFGRLHEALKAERVKVEAAEDRVSQAETLAGQGSFNQNKTRVLHLKRNPLSEATRERYETEIGELKRQIEELSGQKPAASGSSAPEVDPSKLHLRLKEQFKERSGLYREGVRLLTGFKVDMLGDDDRPMFKVRSDYAEQEQDQLMFVWPMGRDVAALDLVETEFAKVVTTTDSYQYMTKFSSVPAFMASVQLSLFEKTTLQY